MRGRAYNPEVLLIATHGGRRWALPKGRIEDAEHPAQAALREVAEETGIRAELLARLETVEYWFYTRGSIRQHKFVEYYLMRYLSGEPVPQAQEVDEVRWLSVRDAIQRVSYANDRRILRAANQLWQATQRRR
jgi:8-oxo-dGTP pyrophosphatase MutT (NUDIX family)